MQPGTCINSAGPSMCEMVQNIPEKMAVNEQKNKHNTIAQNYGT